MVIEWNHRAAVVLGVAETSSGPGLGGIRPAREHMGEALNGILRVRRNGVAGAVLLR